MKVYIGTHKVREWLLTASIGEELSDGRLVKRAVLWRKEIDNRPGMLANTLGPFSEAGADLQVVMGYRYPGRKDMAAIELQPVSGRKSTAAAKTAGLAPSPISALLVQGDNRQGLGHALAKAIGDALILFSGEIAEWSKAPDSNLAYPLSGTEGSNPSLSAALRRYGALGGRPRFGVAL
jgi:hypothetical protein